MWAETRRQSDNAVSQLRDLVCLFVVLVALSLCASIYLPRHKVPSSVSIRCDKLCPSSNFVNTPSGQLVVAPAIGDKYPVTSFAFAGIIAGIVVLSHTLFLVLYFKRGTWILPKRVNALDAINRFLSIVVYVAIASSIPYFTIRDPIVWISFAMVFALAANICEKPFLVKATPSKAKPNWLAKQTKFNLWIMIGTLVTYVSVEMIAVRVGRQSDDFAPLCLKDSCDRRLREALCTSPSSYVTATCTRDQSVWVTSVNAFPDRIVATISFLLVTVVPYAERLGRCATVFSVALSYVITAIVGFLSSTDAIGINGGYLIGTLVGWFTVNIALAELSTPLEDPRALLDGHREAPVDQSPAASPSVPPPSYEMAMADTSLAMPGTGATGTASGTTAIASNFARRPPHKVEGSTTGVGIAETIV